VIPVNCTSCGAENQETSGACKHCGTPLQAAVGDPPYTGPTGTDWKAIASLVCGIAFFFSPAALLAIVFGHLSLAEIRKSAGRLTGHRIAMAGLILGYIGVGLLVILLVVCLVLWTAANTAVLLPIHANFVS
jgi:Domain of unknown function (DUF4190)